MKAMKPKSEIIDDIISIRSPEFMMHTLMDMLYDDEDFVEEMRMKLDEISEENIIYYHKHYRGDLHEHDDE